ncbi:hypothetical protein ACOZ4N_17740 [Halorientalis pallida]|uniref:hypothetical protein n=1 Tax=Halorientalis pallida TaxID=2479928 RepID=UPI003C6EBA8A
MTSCGFTFEHYRDILTKADDNFTFSTFSADPDDTRRLYLRHDIDVSVENAVEMARIEAEHGVKSTYFVAINSPYYNLLNDTQTERLREIAELGHTVGLHVDERGAYMDGFESVETAVESIYELLSSVVDIERVLSFHMPSQYDFNQREEIGAFRNAYATKYTDGDPVKYLSDSNRHWREGCFCEHLGERSAHTYQVLVHPIWWHETPLSNRELYRKLQETTQEGLKVNLKDDIAIFDEL